MGAENAPIFVWGERPAIAVQLKWRLVVVWTNIEGEIESVQWRR